MGQPLKEGRSEISIVTQHHEQRSKGTVDQFNVGLSVFSHELERGGRGRKESRDEEEREEREGGRKEGGREGGRERRE